MEGGVLGSSVISWPQMLQASCLMLEMNRYEAKIEEGEYYGSRQ